MVLGQKSDGLTSAPSGQIHDVDDAAVMPTRLRKARRAQKSPQMEDQGPGVLRRSKVPMDLAGPK
eukprot:9357951-Pyramimonas_sp.AAC.1